MNGGPVDENGGGLVMKMTLVGEKTLSDTTIICHYRYGMRFTRSKMDGQDETLAVSKGESLSSWRVRTHLNLTIHGRLVNMSRNFFRLLENSD